MFLRIMATKAWQQNKLVKAEDTLRTLLGLKDTHNSHT